MPSRIIRDGWLESEPINTLDAGAERFFLRLCLRADDFGRYHANPVLLKSNLFPLREEVRSTDIPRWLAACEKAGLVRCYEVDARRFLEIDKFGQRIKEGSKSKFPAPPGNSGKIPEAPGSAGTIPPHSESESESESESDAKTKAEANGAPAGAGVGGQLPLGVEPDPEVPLPSVLLTEAFKAKWAEWVAYRRERRLPAYKPTSLRAQWAKLAEWGHDIAIAAIDEAIRNQYQGLFQPKANGGKGPGATMR